MAALTTTRLLTYEDYLRTPEMMKRFEIVNGVMEFMTPAPSRAHQHCIGELHVAMKNAAGKGFVYLAPYDLVINRNPLRTRQPDLFFVRPERAHILKDRLDEGPDVVVEVLSPSNLKKAVVEKLADYANIGVTECWMVDLGSQTLEVWRNEKGQFRPEVKFRAGQKVRSRIFPSFVLPAAAFLS